MAQDERSESEREQSELKIIITVDCTCTYVAHRIKELILDPMVEEFGDESYADVIANPDDMVLAKAHLVGPYISMIGMVSSDPNHMRYVVEDFLRKRLDRRDQPYYSLTTVKYYNGDRDAPICSSEW